MICKRETYGCSSTSFSKSSRFGISNISILSEKDTLGVLLPEDAGVGYVGDVGDVGDGGDAFNNIILSVDTEGVRVIPTRESGRSFF